jgi:hypothetical protein
MWFSQGVVASWKIHGIPLPHLYLGSHFIGLTFTMSTKPAKRRRKNTALVEGDLDAAEAVTHEKVTTITPSGATEIRNVLVPLVPIIEERQNYADGQGDHAMDYENREYEEDGPRRTRRVRDLIAIRV